MDILTTDKHVIEVTDSPIEGYLIKINGNVVGPPISSQDVAEGAAFWLWNAIQYQPSLQFFLTKTEQA